MGDAMLMKILIGCNYNTDVYGSRKSSFSSNEYCCM